jgi:hypothetical protein
MDVVKLCGFIAVIYVVLFFTGRENDKRAGIGYDRFVGIKYFAFLDHVKKKPIVPSGGAKYLSFRLGKNMSAADEAYSCQLFVLLGIAVKYHKNLS